MAKTKHNNNKFSKKKAPSFKIYEAINTPIIVISSKTHKPIYCNSAFEELSGYESNEIKTKVFSTFFSKKDNHRVDAIGDILFSGLGEVAEMDLSFRKRSGRKISVNIFAKSMKVSSSDQPLIMAIHDISFIKRLQKEKESAYKEMSHISKLADIGRLAAGVAHELNNPLMIIQGFAENIEQLIENDEIDFNELKWQLNPILKATARMSKIISQLTRLSRDDENIALVIANLAEVLEDVIHLVKNQILYNDIQIERDYDKHVLVKCDPNQIEQIILNIFNNAVHALMQIDSNRKLKVSIKNIDGMTALSIHNNGPEIPQSIREKVMTPFFTTKEVGEGTGLGLSVSYGIMKAHGGDLTFTSEHRLGTQFNLLFPMVQGEKSLKQTLHGVGLVVDDEDLAREIVANKLQKYGFKVIQAQNGKEALDVIKSRNDVDFVFTDAKMPVLDGASLVKEIRSFNKSMLIFAISGFTGIRSIQTEMNKHGINGFLAKPLDHEKFAECIKQIEMKLNKELKAS